MQISAYYSGSTGNLYQVDDLLIEAGVSIKEIKRALGFKLHEIEACLISHEHKDHSMATKDLIKAGIDVYVSRGTAEIMGLSGHRVHTLKAGKPVAIGPWIVLPFNIIHDAVEPLGFLLARGREKLLYATDTHYIPHRFKGLTHIMIETSFDSNILQRNVMAGLVHPDVARRILMNHMSLKTALGVLQANDMTRVQEIHLLHLSNHNSDAEMFASQAQQTTGRPVYVSGHLTDSPGASSPRPGGPPPGPGRGGLPAVLS